MIVIDGYNLMFVYIGNKVADIEEARNKLIDLLHKYCVKKRKSIKVIFDGGTTGFNYDLKKRNTTSYLEIIFTSKGTSADNYIIELARENSEGMKVVTSDLHIREEIEKYGAKITLSKQFMKELLETVAEIKDTFESEEYHSKKYGIPENKVRYWMKIFGFEGNNKTKK